MTTNDFIRDMLGNGVRQAVIMRTLRVSRGRVAGVAWRMRQAAGPGRLRAQKPDRVVVERVIREAAQHLNVSYEDVLGHDGRPTDRVMRARRAAMTRIARETGCSARGLAKVWGATERSVQMALKAEIGPYDAPTLARLSWQHGPDRAAAIVAGNDEATNTDIAAWKRLCARADA